MSNPAFEFEHVHVTSENPNAAADWYAGMLGADITFEREVRGAPQIGGELGGMMNLIRGRRPGEYPVSTKPMRDIETTRATTNGAPIISATSTGST